MNHSRLLKRIFRATGLVALVFCLSPDSARADEPIAPDVGNLYNLLKNGGFEDGDALPSVWQRYPAEDQDGNVQRRDTNTFHTGKASGLIQSVTPYTPGKPWMQWNQYGIPVKGGITLIVSMYVKTEGSPPGHGGIHFYGEGRKHLGFVKIEGPRSADGWTPIRRSVDVPQDAKTIGFAAYAAEKGKTWYDDVAVIDTPETKAMRATPTVDGKLDEPCWNKERAISTFVAHPGARVIAEKVRAWLAYDATNLYVAFSCPHPPDVKLREKATQHDGDTWLDDSIEVFLDPNHQHNDYYQFCVNCRGVIRDSHRTDTVWESGARAAVQRGDEEWTVELAIPYDRLGIGLDAGPVWGINLAWNDRVHGETATWSLGGFHAPGRFGDVSMTPDLSRFFRADVLKQAEEKERYRESVLKEMQNAELPVSVLAEPMKLLDQAKDSLNELRRMADADSKLPEGGWDAVRRRLAAVSEQVIGARMAAISNLFKIGQTGEKGSFRVAIAHSLQKIRRTGPITDAPLVRRVRIEAARDEAESFQLVVMPSGQALKNVQVEAKPLAGAGGTVSVEWHRVEYVETAVPGYPTEYVGWWPDPLLPPGPFDVPADRRQPLWFIVQVPAEAKPGTYTGSVTIRHEDSAVSVPVELHVRNFRLPRPGTLVTAFGIYASALSKHYYGTKSYRTNMPLENFARWCEFLGRYRITPKNVAREYIDIQKDGDQYKVDLTALQTTVAALAPRYYAPYSFCLHRLPSSPTLRKPDYTPSPDGWARLTKAIAEEWRRQGLPHKVYVYGIDEPKPEEYPILQEAYRKIHEAAAGFPIMQTIGDREPRDLTGFVDIWCPLSSRLDSDFYAERLKGGDTLWTYVCCSPRPPYANFFVDRPATEHRLLFWQARQFGATGVLYWCMCWWEGLPVPAAGKPCWPDVPIRLKDHGTFSRYKTNGDGLLIYPGPNMTPYPSIRLEIIRDGIEDYEYLNLLSRLVERAKVLPPDRRPEAALIQEAEALCLVPESISRTLTDYTTDAQILFERRGKMGDMVERLTIMLGAEGD